MLHPNLPIEVVGSGMGGRLSQSLIDGHPLGRHLQSALAEPAPDFVHRQFHLIPC
jgi:hypothetical protein